MTKALEVKIDGELVGVFVPPDHKPFGVMLGNVPISYMRCQVTTGSDEESWYWQLPDLQEGQEITFKLIDAEPGSGLSPDRVETKDPKQLEKRKAAAAEAYKRAVAERNIS